MANTTINLNNGQQLTITTDLSKIFLWNNRYDTAENTNATGATIEYLAGTIMGKIASTGKVIPLLSGAVDGSQYPVGILASDYSVVAGATVTMCYCTAGDVAAEQLIFTGGNTLATVIELKQLRDRIASDTVGIVLKTATNNSVQENI